MNWPRVIMDDELSEIQGTRWLILRELSVASRTPKELAQKLSMTIANVSQQLKLLEAYGYLRKERADAGPGGRKKADRRIMYSLKTRTSMLYTIRPGQIAKQKIKETLLNQLMQNIMLGNFGKDSQYLLKLFIDQQVYFELMDSAYYVDSKDNNIHLLIITEYLDEFRSKKPKIDVEIDGQKKSVVFWSHTSSEILNGVKKGEKYYLDYVKNAKVLFSKKLCDAWVEEK